MMQRGGTTALLTLPSPQSAAKSQNSHYTFLTSLSKNANYKKLLLLLCVAKVSLAILGTCKT